MTIRMLLILLIMMMTITIMTLLHAKIDGEDDNDNSDIK